MTEAEFRQIVARNLTAFRKAHGDTQLTLAEKLKYSDKSISKWERGDGLPDAYVLSCIAEMYGVTMNDLVSVKKPKATSKEKHFLITLLSLGLVWLLGVTVYFTLTLAKPDMGMRWLVFLYATTVSFVVLVVFSCLWGRKLYQFLSVSGLIWSTAVSIYLTFMSINIWLLFVIAGILQIMAALWYLLLSGRKLRRTKPTEPDKTEEPAKKDE